VDAEKRFPGIELAVEEALRAVQTTSPSYILMASMEQAIEVLEREDGAWIDHGTKVAIELAKRLARIPGISVAGFDRPLPHGLFHDPSKLLVNLNLSVNGPAAAKFLVQKCKVVPEMTGPGYILLLVSGAHGDADIDAVERAFKELSEKYAKTGTEAQGAQEAAPSKAREVPRPKRVMLVRDAFLSPRSTPADRGVSGQDICRHRGHLSSRIAHCDARGEDRPGCRGIHPSRRRGA
jgi:arginine/lysine/ornithine decarboxylase